MIEMLKIIGLFVMVLAICSAGAISLNYFGKYMDEKILEEEKTISFEDCVKSGNSAIINDPIRCVDSEGNVYIKKVIN